MRRSIIQAVSTLFPNAIASFAYRQLLNPQVRKLRTNELETLDKAQKEKLRFKDFDIQLYTWQGGKKTILLIHGWEGQAGNFSDLIEALLLEDYTIYSFDGPSHGYSSKGETSLFEFTELVGILIRKYRVKDLISHSFGGVATSFALFKNKDLEINKYVLLTTPDKFTERIDDVSKMLGITNKAKRLLIERLEKETNENVEKLDVSRFVQSINVRQSLIIHDKNDRVIPIDRSKNVHNNWHASAFKEVENTGHFRILRSKEVIDFAMNFLK